jgi:hypothetical protein
VTALTLLRVESNEEEVFGRFAIPGGSILHTLEPPWKDNAPQISCIPAGLYTLRRRFSVKHAMELFGIDGVPDRSDIEIHPGNYPQDTLGCVLPGLARELHAVLRSKEAFARFMDAMKGLTEVPIEVTWAPGLP